MPRTPVRFVVASLFFAALSLALHAEVSAKLIVRCDIACRWSLDGQAQGELVKNQKKILDVELGAHEATAESIDGVYKWAKKIEVKQGEQKLEVELKHDAPYVSPAESCGRLKSIERTYRLKSRGHLS